MTNNVAADNHGHNASSGGASDGRLTIGLLGHSFSSGNLGIQALTVCNLAIARDVAAQLGVRPRFVALVMRDRDQWVIDDPDVELFPMDRRSILNRRGYWAKLGEVDCVLDIGAGDSFTDIYGAKRFGYLWLTKMMAHARRKPVIMSPQTVGPFENPFFRAMARMAMSPCKAIITRDRESFNLARSMVPATKCVQGADVAFTMPYEDRSAERGGPRIRVGVNVSGLLVHEAESYRNRFGLQLDYAEFSRKLIAALLAMPDVEVHLVPHATAARPNYDDDGRLADRLAADFPGVIRVPDFDSPIDVKSYISSLDFLVAGRLHACIAAYSTRTPVVPVAYSRKFRGVFGLVDYDRIVPVTGLDADEAVAYVLEQLAQRHGLMRDEPAKMQGVMALLDNYRQILFDAFSAALGRDRWKQSAAGQDKEMIQPG